MTTGERIRKLRIEKDMTQQELANKCGLVSRASINQYETGREVPNAKVPLIAEALGVSPAVLLGYEITSNINAEYNSPEPDAMDRRLLAYFHGMSDANKFELLAKLAREAENK